MKTFNGAQESGMMTRQCERERVSCRTTLQRSRRLRRTYRGVRLFQFRGSAREARLSQVQGPAHRRDYRRS